MKQNRKWLEQLQKDGKIRGFKMDPRPESQKGNQVPRSDRSKQKEYIELNLTYWCNQKAVTLEREVQFDQQRKFRFDWAIPAWKIAVEFEGGIFQAQSGHNTAKHYTKDTDKYNLAQQLGWTVYRFTAINYKNLIRVLDAHLQNQNNPEQPKDEKEH